jgi:hypothetical protein
LNRFDNWFDKDMDDFANEQLGLAGYATSMVTRGTFQGEDAMEDKGLAAVILLERRDGTVLECLEAVAQL